MEHPKRGAGQYIGKCWVQFKPEYTVSGLSEHGEPDWRKNTLKFADIQVIHDPEERTIEFCARTGKVFFISKNNIIQIFFTGGIFFRNPETSAMAQEKIPSPVSVKPFENMTDEEMAGEYHTLVEQVDAIVAPFGLKAEILEGIYSVGVGGDNRTYTPVANLIGPFPGYETLDKLKTEICNTLPINRVTFQLAVKNTETEKEQAE